MIEVKYLVERQLSTILLAMIRKLKISTHYRIIKKKTFKYKAKEQQIGLNKQSNMI